VEVQENVSIILKGSRNRMPGMLNRTIWRNLRIPRGRTSAIRSMTELEILIGCI
jgi:hypothetical protein